MQLAEKCSSKTLSTIQLTLVVALVLSAFSAVAQKATVGKFLYDKLTVTQQEYQEAMTSGDSMQVAEACYKMGKRYSALGDFVTAQKWFIRSLRIREPYGFSEAIGRTYLRMAENQSVQKHYQKTMANARWAMVHFQRVRSVHGVMSADLTLAGAYLLGYEQNRQKQGAAPLHSLDSAIHYYKQAERLAIRLGKSFDLANVYLCMGAALTLKDGNLAIPYLKKAYAIDFRDRYKYGPYGVVNASQKLAECYLDLHQLEQAKIWLDIAQTICDTARQGDFVQNTHREELYEKLYEQRGDWEQAFRHQKAHYSLLIDAINADREGAIARAELLYDTQKKEARLRAQQREIQLRQEKLDAEHRLAITTTVLFVLAGMACAVFYWLFKKYQRISEHNAKLVREQNHRVKNNLQSITSLLGLQFNRLTDSAARQAVEESLLRVEAMSLVHQRLYDGDRLVEVNLEQFIPDLVGGVLRSYSFGNLRPQYTLSSSWVHADIAINLGLLLNELVTNSCKYALPDNPDPMLKIGCQQLSDRMHIWFGDNGPGFYPIPKGNSFGMKLIGMITEKLKGKGGFRSGKGCYFTLTFDAQPASVLNV